eukprot:CAMPEP_0197051640 /NCGR_PEP_ID=MMETSP1384-20130603/26252_1 /TAXON_ID=29189 /ORGANISM="Ammonia sp." /LENGTH=587 /DNA_ID=CAMNT_0042484231 /DNA_START=22 /DNA_END=1785 /DNA_ORIENTATION=-
MWNALWGSATNKPPEPECMTHFASACRAMQMGQNKEAYEGFMYSIQLDDEYKIEHRISPLMKLLESEEKHEEMLSVVSKLQSKHPKALGMLIWKGVALKHLNRMPECEECFGKAVELQPQNEMFVSLYCSVLMAQKSWSKFLEINKKMIELKPTAGSYHNNYIQALENLHEQEKAEQHVVAILEKYGAISASINFVCGDYYYKHERFDEAEACLKKAAALDMKNEKYQQFYIRALLQNGKQSDADKYCQELISKDPNNVRWINTVGYICFDAFDLESAARHFSKCIELQPNDPYNVLDLAMVLCELGRVDEAEKMTREIVQKQANFVSAQYRLARILEYKQQYKEAQAVYVKAMEMEPNKAKMNMGYAHLLYLMGEYEESMKFFQISAKIDKANPWHHYWFGLLLMSDRYRRYAEAVRSFEKCLQLQATHHQCLYELACLLFNVLKKNRKRALDLLQEAVKVDYKNQEYRKMLKKFMDEYDENEKEEAVEFDDDEKKVEEVIGNVSKLVKVEYLFKSMDEGKKEITVIDDEFNDVVLQMQALKLDEVQQIKQKIKEGEHRQKDVKIVVVETHTKNQKVTKKISHAKV